MSYFLALRCLAVWLGLTASVHASEPLRLFAAASLGGVLEAVEASGCCGTFAITYAGSGTLARQVASGAPADVIVLADEIWMQDLLKRGLIEPPERVASNALVFVSRAEEPLPLTVDGLANRLGDHGRIALGDPSYVPAGRYAMRALDHLGVWESVKERVVYTHNVRAALVFAERGEVPLAIVYRSDVQAASHAVAIADLPLPDDAQQIVYTAALVTGENPQAEGLITFLKGAEGQAILAAHRFLPPPERRP